MLFGPDVVLPDRESYKEVNWEWNGLVQTRGDKDAKQNWDDILVRQVDQREICGLDFKKSTRWPRLIDKFCEIESDNLLSFA